MDQLHLFFCSISFRDPIPVTHNTLDPGTPNIINLYSVDDVHQWLENPNHVYIGRESLRYSIKGSIWGNPHKIGSKTRVEVVVLYEDFIRSQKDLCKSASQLSGKILGCWCSPEPCHGEILHRLAGNVPVHQKNSNLL